MIKITNESKLLTKHIDGDVRVNLMVKKCNSNQNWNSKGVQKKKNIYVLFVQKNIIFGIQYIYL